MFKPYVDKSVPLKPKFVREQLRELEAHIGCLKTHLDETKRRHKKLDITNREYDGLDYHLWQIMLHTSFIRSKMDLTFNKRGCDGNGKQFQELEDGSLFKCYSD